MNLTPSEIIALKRDKQSLTAEQLEHFINGYVEGQVADYQMSALLMAAFLNGMAPSETWALTKAMLHSGAMVSWPKDGRWRIDKHSTGGVGDKTSLILAPIAAAAGVQIPMISGRGLGHTGGTLDKLETIPGLRTRLPLEEFRQQVLDNGLCFIGQTEEICPADKRMYALRDVTSTVECIQLICASIMSKKLAEGIDGLVLDVKFGSGAFMPTIGRAKKLATALASIAAKAGVHCTALLTRMDQVLGAAVGNALEVTECLEILQGQTNPLYHDLIDLSTALAAHMIWMARIEKTWAAARKRAWRHLESGEALRLFRDVIKNQNGSLEAFARQTPAANQVTIDSWRDGFVQKMDAHALGMLSLKLGAGRLKSDETIDPSAGLIVHKKIGHAVEKGEPLITLHSNKAIEKNEAEDEIKMHLAIGAKPKKSGPLIAETLLRKP